MSILGLCLIVLGTIFSFFGTVNSSKQSQSELTSKIQEKNQKIDEINMSNTKLIDQNANLLSTTNEVSNTNKDLLNQNREMLSKVGSYQKEIEERNLKIQQLEFEVNNIKEYSFYATLDITGQAIQIGNGLTYSSDLSNRMKNLIEEKHKQMYVKPDLSLIPQIDEVISKYPKYPFGYWLKYNLLKAFHKSEWKEYAQKCIEIFKITTTISGHNASHDEALKYAIRDIQSNK
jgi:cell division protein FtsB